MAELVSAGLVNTEPHDRYRLTSSVANHLRDHPPLTLDPASATAALLRLGTDYYRLGLARGVFTTERDKKRHTPEQGLTPFPSDQAAFDWAVAEHTNIVAYVRWCADHRHDDLLILIGDVTWPMFRQLYLTDAQHVVQTATAHAADRTGHQHASVAWARVGQALIGLDSPAEAETACANAVHQAEMAHDTADHDDALFGLTAAYSVRSTARLNQGKLEEALQDNDAAIRYDTERRSPLWVIGVRLRQRALILLELTRHPEARDNAIAAIVITQFDSRRRIELGPSYMILGKVLLQTLKD